MVIGLQFGNGGKTNIKPIEHDKCCLIEDMMSVLQKNGKYTM
jgi:hypothetical protein